MFITAVCVLFLIKLRLSKNKSLSLTNLMFYFFFSWISKLKDKTISAVIPCLNTLYSMRQFFFLGRRKKSLGRSREEAFSPLCVFPSRGLK